MELKVGMYVRTKNGMAKYLGLGKDVLTNNESNQFKHYAMQHLFDNYIFDVGHDWGDTLSNEEFKNIDEYIETEPSYNLIDLIELGDYVNGEKVQFITKKRQLLSEGGYDILEKYTGISSVVTKEQFEVIAYEVK